MGYVQKQWEDAWDFVTDDIPEAIGDAVDFILDDIVSPVLNAVGNVIDTILDDPIKAIAQAAAILTGNAWALPLIDGADAIIAGKDIGDVLESMAISYITQKAGSYVGSAAGNYAGELATDLGLSASDIALASEVVGSATKAGTVAVITGKDPLQAFLTGGISAAVPTILGKVGAISSAPQSVQQVVEAAIKTQLNGGNVTAAVLNSLISSSGIVVDTIKSFDPDNKLSTTQQAILADVLMGTATAAITGGNPSLVIQNAIRQAGIRALEEMVTSGFKNTVTQADTTYSTAKALADKVDANIASQEDAAGNYNEYVNLAQSKIAEETRLKGVYDAAIAAHNANPSQATADAANAAVAAYNGYVTAFSAEYNEQIRPKITEYARQLDTLKQEYAVMNGDYEAAIQAFANSTDKISAVLDPIYRTSNRAFVEAMNPDFNAEEYRKLNGLGADVDIYEHFLGVGQFEGLPVNASQALSADAKPTTIAKTTTAPAVNNVFDGSEYMSTVAAQKAAVASGMNYFIDPETGSTYKILTAAEVTNKIKSATSFAEAYSMARKAYGADGTFEWTNPATGKTTSFNTQTKEEAAAASNAGSLVKVNQEVTDYVNARISENILDFKNWNSAELNRAEYAAYVDSYLNATDAQRQLMLKGNDRMTYGVIDGVLKNAPQMIQQAADAKFFYPSASGTLTASEYTNYLQVMKAAGSQVAGDIANLAVTGLQGLNATFGYDTATLDRIKQLIAEDSDTEMSKLVGNEKVIAGGLASGITSAASWMIGGPALSIATIGAITANNSWLEGSTAVIDSRGFAYKDAAEAQANGVWTFRALTTSENAYRTALLTSLEIAGESVGVPGMSKIMKGIPIGGTTGDIVNAVKNYSLGMGSEVITEILTTTAQMAADKISTFGLGQNATWADYQQAVQDTTLATMVAVGTSGSMATVRNNLRAASIATTEWLDAQATIVPMTYNTVVAKTASGADVTFAELVTAQSLANFDSAAAAEEFANLTPTYALNTYIQVEGMDKIALGDIFADVKATADNSFLSESTVAEIFRQQDFNPVYADYTQFTGKVADTTTINTITTYIDQNTLDLAEVKEIAKQEGITLTDAQAQEYVKQGNEAELTTALQQKLDPTATTYEEAKGMFINTFGYVPTYNEIQQFVGVINETTQSKAIGEYVDPRQMTKEEAKQYLIDQGYTPTDAEVTRFVGQLNEQTQVANIAAWADPRVVDIGEVEAAYAALGLSRPTQADVQALLGQYAESDLAGKAETSLPTARYNSVLAQLDALAEASGQDQAILDAIALVKSDFSSQITDLGFKVDEQTGALTDQITTTEKNILDKVAEYEAAGLSRDEATQKAIDAVAIELNTTKEDILKRLGTTEENLSATINTLSQDVSALGTQLATAETNIYSKMAEYEKAGISRDEALSKAIADVAADLGTTKEALLTQLGVTEETLTQKVSDVETNLGTSIADSQAAILKELDLVNIRLSEEIAAGDATLATQITDVEAAVLDRVNQYEQAGISRDEATQQAIADVAAELNTTREEVLKQVRMSQLALGEQIGELQNTIGTNTQQATQQDLNEIINLLETQGVYDQRYDFNGDQIVDQNDRIAIEQRLTGDTSEPWNPYEGSKWAPTGVFKTIADEAEATRQAQAAEAERTRQAQAASALKTQRMGNMNTLMDMLGQAGDVGGQQVTVNAADPAKIGYIYDWNSIFANPSQEGMFASPYGAYAQGGVVQNDSDDVNNELLKLLRG